MNNDIAHLSPERHYTAGAANAGRYATDPRRRSDMNRLPTPADLARRQAARPAWLARYLRQQDVLGWVARFDQARGEADALRQEVLRLEGTAEGRADEEVVGDAPGDAPVPAAGDRAAGVRARLVRAEDRKREASRQLRLMGISPRAQAAVSREMRKRVQDERAV